MRALLLVLPLFLAACGETPAGSGAAYGGAGGAAGGGPGGAGGACQDRGAGGAPAAPCDAVAEQVLVLAEGGPVVTAVVRLDAATLRVLGWQVEHQPYAGTTGAEALALAAQLTGGSPRLVGSAFEGGFFVAYAGAGAEPDGAGGLAAISSRSGKVALGATFCACSVGTIRWPESFRPPSELGSGCGAPGNPGIRAVDLSDGDTVLAPADVTAVLAAAGATGIPTGLARGFYPAETLVVRYQPLAGEEGRCSAEWLVVYHWFWLE